MNYRKHYNSLIFKALYRKSEKDAIYEKHHIIPRCLGGVDCKSNLVNLTPREHFVAHQLLVKMYPDHAGLKYSLFKMTTGTTKMIRNNRCYEWIKEQLCDANRKNSIQRWKDNHHERQVYSERTKEQWENLSLEAYNKICHERSRRQSGTLNSFYGRTHKEESKLKMSDSRKQIFENMSAEERIKKIPQLRVVSVNGISYPGLSYAARELGIGPGLLHYRLNSNSTKWAEYFYLS